jgi:acyl-CoA reductase-like NAD-dependent aldehyde dehydrogenase
MPPEIIAEITATTFAAVEWHVAAATDATPPTPWISRTPEQRAALITGALDDIEKHPVSDADTLEALDADLRVALARRIARAVGP